MTPKNIALFIVVDLLFLLALLLFLSYYGMSHLIILLMGFLFLVLTLYDLKTQFFSELFSEFLGLAGPPELGNMKWLPVILSALLLYLSLPVLLEHGLVNTTQRWAMQHGQFTRVAIPAVAGGIIVMAIAVWTLFKGSRKE